MSLFAAWPPSATMVGLAHGCGLRPGEASNVSQTACHLPPCLSGLVRAPTSPRTEPHASVRGKSSVAGIPADGSLSNPAIPPSSVDVIALCHTRGAGGQGCGGRREAVPCDAVEGPEGGPSTSQSSPLVSSAGSLPCSATPCAVACACPHCLALKCAHADEDQRLRERERVMSTQQILFSARSEHCRCVARLSIPLSVASGSPAVVDNHPP